MLKEDIVKTLIENNIATNSNLIGCSEEEIQLLELSIGNEFPKFYREYLLAAGHSAGDLFLGTDITFSILKEISEEAKLLLNENEEEFTMPYDAFVCYMHQGYIFGYFRFSEGEDPPIYEYFEGKGKPNKAWNNFKEFFNDSLTITIEFNNQRAK